MKKGKIIRFVGVCGLALGALGAATAPVLTTNHVATVTATAIEDNTSDRAITIHKYGTDDATQVGQNGGTTLPGAPSDSTKNPPLAGISFKVEKITKAGTEKLNAADSSTYSVDASFSAKTVTTDSTGTAVADLGSGQAADGYYLVTEQASAAIAKASAPFIVHIPLNVKGAAGSDDSLEYNVNVYPKNQVASIKLNPTKTFPDGTMADSVKSGASVSWDLTIDRPVDIHGSGVVDDGTSTSTSDSGDGTTTTTTKKWTTYASELKMTDVLDDTKMSVGDNPISSVTITSTDEGGTEAKTALTADDYKVEKTTADGKTTVTVELTDSGIQKFAAAPDGSKLTATLDTTVKADSSAAIDNTFSTDYKGTATPNGETETTNTPGNPKPTVYFGNVDVMKTDDAGKALAKATFTLYPTEADAKAGTNPVTTEKGDPVTVTTDDSGKAEITGLEVDPTSKTKDYYLVETAAPVGYDVDPQVFKVTATQDSKVDATVKDHDNLIPNLPLTGSQGRILLYALTTGLIVIGATGVIVIKKRQRNA
ncbi:SpaH/EbpB family LPXTG-anchored major pilin [Lacticaseibacillus hegangensis]|uniref:SpaH/EbpB family LPXTG-anchored major pilin n=1 Tax=Lacticaseibacillus hegangensis TaxID=2486010 RepID=A0ABW4D0V7_9LACO|nr:SpaH/EbpB family LPXTG-anchored major pilin [Lacticaseibacillus hegangensis]